MAPEVMALMDFDYSSDVYSFAIILWEMLTGQEPYPDAEDYQSLYNMVVIEGVRPPLNESAAIPEEIKPLLEKCWHADLTLRPNFDKIIRALENVIIPIVISPLPGSTSVPFWTSAFGHPPSSSKSVLTTSSPSSLAAPSTPPKPGRRWGIRRGL
jgi:serine/threonine protein kinase